MEAHNIEYQTAVMDTDHCKIYKAACNVVDKGEMIQKCIADFRPDELECGHNILGIRWKIKRNLDKYCWNGKDFLQDNVMERSCSETIIAEYLNGQRHFNWYLHTDYKPIGGPHYHGNPLKGWQDWMKVRNVNVMSCVKDWFSWNLQVTETYHDSPNKLIIREVWIDTFH